MKDKEIGFLKTYIVVVNKVPKFQFNMASIAPDEEIDYEEDYDEEDAEENTNPPTIGYIPISCVLDKRILDAVHPERTYPKWEKRLIKRKYGKYPAVYLDVLVPYKPTLCSMLPRVKFNKKKFSWRVKKI